jgi:hypothetical protein
MPPNESLAREHALERLTWRDIRARFPDEWVVLVDVDWANDTDFEFGHARVLAHFKSRKEASPFIKAAFQRYTEVGSFWTGEIRGPVPRFVP